MNTLQIWQIMSSKPGGKWAFSKAVCLKVPYFKSINPIFIKLSTEICQVQMKKSKNVLNHLNTVHAIAMCNMAELAGGMLAQVNIPTTHRWIPKGMKVEYIKKAMTDLTATASIEASLDLSQPSEYPVTVVVTDDTNEIVFKATISMWVSPNRN